MSALAADLEALAGFGYDDGGISRLAWSPELAAANEWLVDRFRAHELDVEVDAAGNVFGKWQAGSGRAILAGSHLDTVARGGRYDGALGVVAALAAVRLLRSRGLEPRRPIWVVSFNDEEGARFGTALFGSRAFVGEDVGGLAERRDARGVTLRAAMAERGFDFARVGEARGVDRIAAYLELHVEQGVRLERAGVDVGVVTSIAGQRGYRACFLGKRNHAGTTPMSLRHDALAGAARAVLEVRNMARERDDLTATVGVIGVEAGARNVVPGACEFTLDVRSPDADVLAEAERFALEALERIAAEEGLRLEVREAYGAEPVPLAPELRAKLARAAEAEGASALELASGAGHDAMVLAKHVPTGMLFVPSRDGISHSPEEYTAPEHCELGARVLARALGLLATG